MHRHLLGPLDRCRPRLRDRISVGARIRNMAGDGLPGPRGDANGPSALRAALRRS